MPRLVPPAVDAIAIYISSREIPSVLDGCAPPSALLRTRTRKKRSQRRKNDRKGGRKAPRQWDYDFGIRCAAKEARGVGSALEIADPLWILFTQFRTENRYALFLELL
jgi:hypothetical protein